MDKLNEKILDDNFFEVLWFVINDFFVLSKEIEWAFWWDNLKRKNDKNLKFPNTRKYFTKKEVEELPLILIKVLENLLKDLSRISKELSLYSDNQKQKIVDFINNEIKKKEKNSTFMFPYKFKDLIFFELWIDHIDDIWEARNETNMLLDKIMMMK